MCFGFSCETPRLRVGLNERFRRATLRKRSLEAKPGGGEVATAAPAPFLSGAPHLPQKSEVGGFSALHFVQVLVRAFPHFAQKLLVEGLFVPHFEQRIGLPIVAND